MIDKNIIPLASATFKCVTGFVDDKPFIYQKCLQPVYVKYSEKEESDAVLRIIFDFVWVLL